MQAPHVAPTTPHADAAKYHGGVSPDPDIQGRSAAPQNQPFIHFASTLEVAVRGPSVQELGGPIGDSQLCDAPDSPIRAGTGWSADIQPPSL